MEIEVIHNHHGEQANQTSEIRVVEFGSWSQNRRLLFGLYILHCNCVNLSISLRVVDKDGLVEVSERECSACIIN